MGKTKNRLPLADDPVKPSPEERLKQDLKIIRHFETLLEDDNILDNELRMSLEQSMNKAIKKYVDTAHKYSIRAPREGGAKPHWETKIVKEGRQVNITAKTEEGLYKKLYEFYGGTRESVLLNDLIIKALQFRHDTGLSDKTLAIYMGYWNKYYKDSAIAKKDITQISPEEWYNFFWNMVSSYHLNKRDFRQVTIVINTIVSYCIHKRILYSSPVRDIIKDGDFPYVKAPAYNQIKAKNLTGQQIEKIIEWCNKELQKPKTHKEYIYAILVNFRAGLRIGELKGLTWDDIDLEEGNIHISKQVVNTCSLNTDGGSFKFTYKGDSKIDHLKACENERNIPIGRDLIEILEKVKDMNLSDTQVFPLRYNTYNNKVKAAAAYAGITDLRQIRTHSFRTTAASNIYAKTHDIKTVQAFLGHTTPEMTAKYIKGQDSYEALKGII